MAAGFQEFPALAADIQRMQAARTDRNDSQVMYFGFLRSLSIHVGLTTESAETVSHPLDCLIEKWFVRFTLSSVTNYAHSPSPTSPPLLS